MNTNLIPSVESYNPNSDQANAMQLNLPGLTLYYSYKTVVAFYDWENGMTVSQNDWGVTTGKHLGWIDGGDRKNRLPRREFDAKLEEALRRTFGKDQE